MLSELISTFGFIPTPEACGLSFNDSVFTLCKTHLGLVKDLNAAGFDLKTVNEHIMERLLNNTYVNLGYINAV
jgi:hypothetical protein